MNAARLASTILAWRLALARRGGLELCALLLLALGAAAWLAALQPLERHASARETQVQDARRQASAPALRRAAGDPPPALIEQRLHDFQAALGDVAHAEDALRAIFAAAEKREIELDQSDYKLGYDAHGRFYTYAVQLPVVGSYAAIRQFGEQVLMAVPYASLDEVDFKREDIGNPDLGARLRFTLHLNGPPGLAGEAVGSVPRKAATP